MMDYSYSNLDCFQVGEFHSSSSDNRTISYSPKFNIDWPGNHKPVDEPHCGFDGSKCPRTKGRTEIAAGVLGGWCELSRRQGRRGRLY